MRNRFANNIYAIICVILVFATMLIFFTFISPSVPYDADDWNYLSKFPVTPIPAPPFDTWNPSRIFPEHLMPVAGYFSSFVVYPLTGDYILSISITTALLLSIFLAVFYLSLYRLFLSLDNNKSACAIIGLFAMALCFALLKRRTAENLHLFIVYSLNLHYFYTLPNILNSIVVCELMRLHVKGSLSLKSIPRKAPLLIILLYFCVFSMLFSTLTLLAFAVSVLLFKFIDSVFRRKEKLLLRLKHFGVDSWKHSNIAAVSVVLILYAMVAESFGGRARWDNGSTFSGSVFSAGFISRMFEASQSLLGFVRTFNTQVFVIIALIVILAVGAYIYYRKRAPEPAIVKAAQASFLSCVIAFLSVILVSGKGGTQYADDIRSVYSVFFFAILFVSLAAVYLCKNIPVVRKLFPLAVVLVILIAVNAKWPYAYTYERTHTQSLLIDSYIEKAVEADKNGDSIVELKVPEYTASRNWPIHLDSWGEAFSNTLYSHHVTSGRIEFVLVVDKDLSAP